MADVPILSDQLIVSIIAAVSPNGVIGRNGNIPWNCPEDMAFFKMKTMNHPVVMGRTTYDSLKVKPLPDRLNIVLTKNKDLLKTLPPHKFGPYYVDHIKEAIEMVDGKIDELFIIGGAQIYQEALNIDIVDKMYINVMKEEVKGDAYFPFIENTLWEIEKTDKEKFESYVYTRKREPEDYT